MTSHDDDHGTHALANTKGTEESHKAIDEEECDATDGLPQPNGKESCCDQYEYLLYEDWQGRLFGEERFKPNTAVWVLTSKGKQSMRGELFLRARVVSDDEEVVGSDNDGSTESRRVLVRYPKGSTYRVKASMLIPVMERGVHTKRTVLVMAETPEYRRSAVVHTCIGDSFLEIGCDFGPTIDRVQKALEDVNGAPLSPTDPPVTLPKPDVNKHWCIGIDKSSTSINIANERYPHCRFSLEDALELEGVKQYRRLCRSELQNTFPAVIAIDINGNREVPAVLQCLQLVMETHEDLDESEDVNVEVEVEVDETEKKGVTTKLGWELPRLILVKSRLLHRAFQEQRIVNS